MGIGLNSVHLLATPLRALGELRDKTVLTLGTQDCAFTYDDLLRLVIRHGIPHAPLAQGEIELTDGFKWVPPAERKSYERFIHQRTLFRVLGFRSENIRSLDYSAFEGADIVQDLNVPVDAAWHGRFDLVYDGGTLEHVFSTKDCLFNMSRLCRLSGMVVSVTPTDLINHGFINVNAGLYRDFFTSNGYEQVALKYIGMPSNPVLARRFYIEYEPHSLHHPLAPFYAMHVFSAFRKVRDEPLKVPNQTFYEDLWAAGQPAQPWGAGGGLLRRLRAGIVGFIDSRFALAALVHGYRMLLRGRRVSL
jgi:hypothetical protein